MKQLTLFTDAWYPQFNGVVTTLDTTRKELERRGWIVKVIHPGLFRFTVPLQPSTGIYMPIMPMGITDEEVLKADKIHIATEGAIGIAAKYSAKKYNKPFTTSFHTKYPEYVEIHTGIPSRISSLYFRWFHRGSNSVMVATPSMVDYCNKLGIKNIRLWSRGVDTNLFQPKDKMASRYDNIYTVYVGRVSYEKNLEAYLSIKNPLIQKTIIGDGPQLEELKEKYPGVTFLGKRRPEEIAKFLPYFDVFAWPSLTDTFGLVVLEAMACGLPVAGFDNEVNRNIIEHGKSGILVPETELEQAIFRARDLKRDDAVAQAKKFSWESSTDQFISNLV